MTLCAKNHFGSVYRENTGPSDGHRGWNPSHLHLSINVAQRPMGTYNALVDLMGHPDLGGKTILYLLDALYAAPHQSVRPEKWQSPPAVNDWTSSVLASQDAVAIESVAVDLLGAEASRSCGGGARWTTISTKPLAQKPPSGTRYAGGRRQAPGKPRRPRALERSPTEAIHRNLGTGEGIELVTG